MHYYITKLSSVCYNYICNGIKNFISQCYYYITNNATIKYYDSVLGLHYCYTNSQFTIL